MLEFLWLKGGAYSTGHESEFKVLCTSLYTATLNSLPAPVLSAPEAKSTLLSALSVLNRGRV